MMYDEDDSDEDDSDEDDSDEDDEDDEDDDEWIYEFIYYLYFIQSCTNY